MVCIRYDCFGKFSFMLNIGLETKMLVIEFLYCTFLMTPNVCIYNFEMPSWERERDVSRYLAAKLLRKSNVKPVMANSHVLISPDTLRRTLFSIVHNYLRLGFDCTGTYTETMHERTKWLTLPTIVDQPWSLTVTAAYPLGLMVDRNNKSLSIRTTETCFYNTCRLLARVQKPEKAFNRSPVPPSNITFLFSPSSRPSLQQFLGSDVGTR